MALTEAGKVLYREAQALLRQAEDVRVLVRRVDAGLRGRLRIGFVGSMLYRGLPALLAAMRAELPEVEHVLAELNSHDQIEAVHRGELDLGFIHANPLPEGVQAQDLVAEPFVVCLPSGHALARARQPGAGRAGRRGLRVLRASGLAQLLRDGAVAVRDGRLHAAGAARGASLAERGRAGVAGTGGGDRAGCLSRSGLAGTRFIGFEHEARSVSQAIWPAGAARRCRKARCGW